MTCKQNLHTHTTFDDGAGTPAEMARAALAAGLTSLGFSGHSPMAYENDWALTADTLPKYRREVERVRSAYEGRLAVYCGLEWDASSPMPSDDYDYIIGSLHLISPGEESASIDYEPSITRDILDRRFGGDSQAMVRAYFDQYAALAADPRIDIIGHFDLITKFCESDGLFDAHAPYLLRCARQAMEPLARAGKIFEVNTGAMARGRRSEPYPSVPLLRTLLDMGGRVTLSSDAHSADKVAYGFAGMERLLKDIGFAEIWMYDGNSFVPTALSKPQIQGRACPVLPDMTK